METLLFHPEGKAFLMAGRLAQGKWNTALFDHPSGKLIHSLDTKMRVTSAKIAGAHLILAGAVGQQRKKDRTCPAFGRLKIYRWMA
jgi:L-ascorbate metabolism protein UlaG (beta-lactamase superfamily)